MGRNKNNNGVGKMILSGDGLVARTVALWWNMSRLAKESILLAIGRGCNSHSPVKVKQRIYCKIMRENIEFMEMIK